MPNNASAAGEEDRAFLQMRIASFGRAMTLISGLGVLAHALVQPVHILVSLWFGLLLADTAIFAGLWLFCSRGSWSVRLLRALEASVLVLSSVLISAMGRCLAGVAHEGTPVPPGQFWAEIEPHLVGYTRAFVGLAIDFGLALTVVARAALVPTPPRRTLALTAVVGIAPLVIMSLPHTVLDLPAIAAIQVSREYVRMTVLNGFIWWTITTVVCGVISHVIYGLRREVREARQLGQYTLERKLGEGGMGAVYKARHAMMSRPTAVKLLPAGKSGERSLARFEREVQQTARLTHPNTITIFDYGRTPDGVFYYAMELLDGDTLEAVVETTGAMPPARVVHILKCIADALAEAHGIGLIHRDIKPANILLCWQGGHPDVPKVVDFGLVKQVVPSEDAKLTHDRMVTGTPLYMAPESLTQPEAVDARSDLYALGAVGYYMLTGQHVFEAGSVMEVCAHHLHTTPTPPSERLGAPVAEDLEAVISKCLNKRPADRPASAQALVALLDACSDAGLWGHEDARVWWAEHGEGVLGARQANEAIASTKTIAVDLARKRA